jgi:hypothetical protein
MRTHYERRIQRAEKARAKADWEYEDKDYPRADWKAEVVAWDTQLGYFDWVIHQIESHA